MYKCQECGRKFKTVKAAERAANNGCPKCGGVDTDIECPRTPTPADADLQRGWEYQYRLQVAAARETLK